MPVHSYLAMALYMIGIGLSDEKDITVRGLEYVRASSKVFLEHYTSILGVDTDKLSSFYGKDVILASRDMVEKGADEILSAAKDSDVSFLVVGDVFSATTHADLMQRAQDMGITVKFVHNASVLTAIGVVGLELYKYGKTTSIVFPDGDWIASTPYEVIRMNKEMGLHTLCLLDIKVAEPSRQDILRGVDKPQPPRYMTVAQALDTLLRIEKDKKEGVIDEDMLVIGVARLGHDDYTVKAGTLLEMREYDFGGPLHSLIIPGKMHFVEEEAVDRVR